MCDEITIDDVLEEIVAGNNVPPSAYLAVNDLLNQSFMASSFMSKLVPPVTVTEADLSRQVDTDTPCVVLDTDPIFVRCGAPKKYRTRFVRTLTCEFTADVDTLKAMSREALREMLVGMPSRSLSREYDASAMLGFNKELRGRGKRVGFDGFPRIVQWRRIRDFMTRGAFVDGMKILTYTQAHLNPALALMNYTTALDILKWGSGVPAHLRDAVMTQGVTSFKKGPLFGLRVVPTHKAELVPDGTVYFFPASRWVGRHLMLETPSVRFRREGSRLKWSASVMSGITVMPQCVARADYQPRWWRRWFR